MSAVGILSMLWGVIILSSRGPLLVAPAATLRGYRAMVKTNARIRILGTVLLFLAAWTLWAAYSEESTLATVLSFFGWIIVGIGIPALVLFPRVYKVVVEGMLADGSSTNLFGWRMLGLAGAVIGVALVAAGLDRL